MMLVTAVMAVLVAAGQAVPAAPTTEQLKNATYKGIEDGPVTLKDGAYEGKPFRADSAMRLRVGLQAASVVTGDLNGDGVPEALALLWKSSGGSGVFTYVAVVGNKGGKVENVATALIGDRQQVRSLSIVDRRIVVDVIGHGPGEPMCCPTQKQRLTWELAGGRLRELPKQVLGVATVADLEGRAWTLQGLDNGQPLAADVSVTLTVRNGRVGGTGGCNSYSGAVTVGDGARALKIGPLISTRKFCAGVESEVERKYLAALQTVFQFGFVAGDLALTYKDGSAVKTLMFSGK
jgi:heat shock protein HslJ